MQTAKPIDMDQAARISLRLYHPVKERGRTVTSQPHLRRAKPDLPDDPRPETLGSSSRWSAI
jgi:hypothetical protein